MKYWKLPYQEHPTWIIDLSQLSHYTEICSIFKDLDIQSCVYTFIYDSVVIKHGLSADNARNYGDRIYRQAGHLPGWGDRLSGPSGSDMDFIADDYHQATGIYLNRNNMIIMVRDLTKAPNPNPSDPKWVLKKVERELIVESERHDKERPIGNRKDESYMDRKTFIPPEVDKLFGSPDDDDNDIEK